MVDNHATNNPGISDVKREKSGLKLRISLDCTSSRVIQSNKVP